MATAKLWWNGSQWRTSSAYWVDEEITNSYANFAFSIKIIAYDDFSIKMESSMRVTHGTNTSSAALVSGSKVIKSGGTTLINIGATSVDKSKTVTNYSSFSYSGECKTQGVAGGVSYAGAISESNGSTTISSPTRTLSFNANHGSGAPSSKTVLYNISTKIPGTIPTRTGYTFLGWSKSATATTASYYSGDSIAITSNTTLYAVWKVESYTLTTTHPSTAAVTILKNGTAYTGNAVNYGDVLTVSFTPSSGYIIDTATLNGESISSGDTHTVAGDVAIEITTVAGYSTIATYDSVVETLGTFHLTVNQFNPDHYCKVRYYDSNSTLLDTSAAFTTTTSIAIPKSWFANFASVTAITITAELTTYTDSSCTTQTGLTDTRTFTVTADASMKPTLLAGCITLAPYNTGTGVAALTSPGYVKGFSKVQAVFDENYITHASGASTDTYSITVQSTTTSDSPPNTTIVSSNTLTLAETLTVTYRVTDSRGRFTESTQTITVNDYIAPSVSAVVKRTDSGGTEDEGGTYMTVTPTATYAGLADNAVTLTLHCKPAGGSYVSYGTITDGATTLFGNNTLSPDTSYIVKVTVTDTVGSSSYIEISMPKRSWEFHIGRVNGNTGAAFGKVTEYGETLQLASGWKFMMDDTIMTEADLAYLLDIDTVKVSKTGDTMTGNLIIANSGADLLTIKLNDFPLTAPASDNYLRAINITDANDAEIGKIEVHYRANGRRGIQISADRNINGTDIYNGLALSVKDNGDSVVTFDQKDAWLTALGLNYESTTTISSIVTGASGVTIESAGFYSWGRLAQIKLTLKYNSALSSATTLATVKSGYRPISDAILMCTTRAISVGRLNSSGGVWLNPNTTIAANTSLTMFGTYLLP